MSLVYTTYIKLSLNFNIKKSIECVQITEYVELSGAVVEPLVSEHIVVVAPIKEQFHGF